MSARQERVIRSLMRSGRYDEAANMLSLELRDSDFHPTDGVLGMLEECSRHSAVAMMMMATLYSMGRVREPKTGEAIRLLETASKAPDPFVASHAVRLLGNQHVREGRHHTGLKILREAKASGVAEAAVEIAMVYLSGAPGLEPDFDRGISLLAEAVDDGVLKANTALAGIMLANEIEIEGYDAVELLEEAASHGDREAEILLDEFFDEEDDEAEEGRDILPYEVVPDGMKRPRLARDALMQEIEMPREAAEHFVARLHGFECWHRLQDAAESPDMPKGVFDEDCAAAEFNHRALLQAEVLLGNGFREEAVAEKVVELLRVTGRKGKPSLRRLSKELEGRLFDMGARQLEEQFGMFAESLGLDGGFESFMSFLRSAHPVAAEAWIDALRDFGWKLHGCKPRATKDGSLIARTRDASGIEYDVVLSAVMFIPGDLGDVHVEGQMLEVEGRGRPAVLLFNRPMSMGGGGGSVGLLYGGRLYSEGAWSDFVLRPEGNVDDAIAQKGLMDGRPLPGFVERFGFKGARDACVLVDANVRGHVLSEGERVGFIEHASGWASPVSGEFGEMLRQHHSERRRHI